MTSRVLIVGASVAGVRTAQALRSAGHQGSLVLVSAESHLPYDKPPLSKNVIADPAFVLQPLLTREQAAEENITLELSQPAVALNLADRAVRLANGRTLAYDALVIATGATARRGAWITHERVTTLRTLDDALKLRAALTAGDSFLVIGAGFIGCEVAAAARRYGVQDVEVVEPTQTPMGRALDPHTAARFVHLHRGSGVSMTMGVGVLGLEPSTDHVSVRLSDGSLRSVGHVVIGIGAEPQTSWLAGSGLAGSANLAQGVPCDAHGRVIGSTNVYALGDVAAWRNPRSGSADRAEHWTNAVDQAAVVAHNLLHPDQLRVHAPVPYVWSHQHHWMLQLVGRTGTSEHGCRRIALDGADPDNSFAVLYGDTDGRLCGAAVVNWPRAFARCRQLLSASGSDAPPLDETAGVVTRLVGKARIPRQVLSSDTSSRH